MLTREIGEQIASLLPQYIAEGTLTTCTWPLQLWAHLITWAHPSLGTGHPGMQQTYSLLCLKYWWPNILDNVNKFVSSCTTCAMSKVPCTIPSSNFQPLPVSSCPWSHIVIHFIMDLHISQGYTVIYHAVIYAYIMIIVRVSKSIKLIPLPKLPSAFQMAKLLFQHVFLRFGIPEDVVSDRGPWFMSCVWLGFMEKFGVSMSLTLGYHPQKLLQHFTTHLMQFYFMLGYQPPFYTWKATPTEAPAV